MKLDRLLVTLTLLTACCASTGCARWSLWPQAATPAPQPNPQAAAKPQGPSSLLQAVGLDRSAKARRQANIAARKQQQQRANLDLKHLDPALALARLAERQGDPSEARRQYRRYIDMHPSHPLPHHRLGVMAARESRFQEAEAHMRRAAQMAPPSAELLSDMGYLCFLQDRLQEAEHLLQQARQMDPSNQNVNNNLASVLAAKGNFDGSLRHFRKVNEEAQARANLAYVHSQQGDLEKARQEYLRALTLDNTLKPAAQALLQVEEAHQREQAAIAQYQSTWGDELIGGPAPADAPQARPMPVRATAPPRELAHVPAASFSYPAAPVQAPAAPAARVPARGAIADQHNLMLIPPPIEGDPQEPDPRRYEPPMHSAPTSDYNAVRQVSHAEWSPASFSSPTTASFTSPPATVGEQAARANEEAMADQTWGSAWQDLLQEPDQSRPSRLESPRQTQPDAFEMLGNPHSRRAAPQPHGRDGTTFAPTRRIPAIGDDQ